METSILQPNVSGIEPDGDYSNLRARSGLAAWLGCVAAFGLVGNSLVVLAMTLYPKLRTTTNVFITSLAVSDMLVCLIVPWIIVGLVSTTGWPLPAETCVLIAILRFTLTGSSVWHLVLIGFNRMVLITTCMETYNKIFNRINTVLFLVSTWMIPFMVIVIPYAAGETTLGYDAGPHLCSDQEERPDGSISRTHMYLSATFLSCIPIAITLSFYVRIYIFIRRHVRRQQMWAKPVSQPPVTAAKSDRTVSQPNMVIRDEALSASSQPPVLTGNDPLLASQASSASSVDMVEGQTNVSTSVGQSNNTHLNPGGTTGMEAGTSGPGVLSSNSVNPAPATTSQTRQANNSKKRQDLEMRITKNTFLVVIALIMCLIPYGVFILTEIGPNGTPLALSTLIFNTCLNPLIYGTKHPQFRVAIKSILTRHWSKGLALTSNSVAPSSQTT